MQSIGYFFSEVLNVSNSNTLSNVLTMGAIRRTQDHDTSDYILWSNEGKLKIPKSEKSLDLKNNYLLIQSFFPSATDYNIQINVTCRDSSKKKLIFSNIDSIKPSENFSLIPNTSIFTEKWVNLCIDIGSFLEHCFKSQLFCIDNIQISGKFKLRLIISLKFSLTETDVPLSMQARNYSIPSNYDLPIRTQTQIFSLFKLKNFQRTHNSLSVFKPEFKLKKEKKTLNNSLSVPKMLTGLKKGKSDYYKKLIAKIILKNK